MDIDIAVMSIADYEDVYGLWKGSDGIGLSAEDSKESIRIYLERNPNLSFVARCDGALAGAVLCGHDGRRGYIHHLAVDAKFRRKGVGKRLIDRCLAALGQAGIPKCHLFRFVDNAEGLMFWEDIGWSERTDLRVMSKFIQS